MSNNADEVSGNVAQFMRLAGTLAYIIFRVEAWIIGSGALAFAVVFYLIGAMKPFAEAIGVAVGTAFIYLIVTKVIHRISFSAPANLVNSSSAKEKP